MSNIYRIIIITLSEISPQRDYRRIFDGNDGKIDGNDGNDKFENQINI
ncbi:hypothetical protein [Candidatus Nitrosocosmicus arcticus]|uniref:Uncharacterized protein n=1 Tax=Candidatus Nitrosocosmicus arcticus TaxID=2035267 RepID=A0A557SSV1_9ARCH|nr:hypothetical protein [Candidatus Nitrosocosmicus arcticus]TVP39672.1 hypothetical protein NARC_130011 [Candidatus Nitrosocosmicus arcticus]